MTVDIAALTEARAHHAMMVSSYGKATEKLRQNEALVAAGLKPLHPESSLKWDAEQLARHERMSAALDHVIAYHEGRVYVPGEVGA